MKLNGKITWQNNSYRYRADIEDYRYLRDIVPDDIRDHYYADDIVFIAANPLLELDLDVATRTLINRLFWAEYSWRRIGCIIPFEFVSRLNARVLSVEQQYQKFFATTDAVHNPFANYIYEYLSENERSREALTYNVNVNKNDTAVTGQTASLTSLNSTVTNELRNDQSMIGLRVNDETHNGKRSTEQGGLNERVTGSDVGQASSNIHMTLTSEGRSSENQGLVADNARNMATQDAVAGRMDTPQVKQGDFIGDFVKDRRGTGGTETAINKGFITNADRNSNITNNLSENRSTNTSEMREDVYRQNLDQDQTDNFNQSRELYNEVSHQNLNGNDFHNTVQNNQENTTSVESSKTNQLTGEKTGIQGSDYTRSSALVYSDGVQKIGDTNKSLTRNKETGLRGMTLSKALDEYRRSVVNYQEALLNEFEDLFLGVL